MDWTNEKLEGLTLGQRAALYDNARRQAATPAGAALKTKIEALGLPYSEGGGMADDAPLSRKIREIVCGPEGREAMQAAAAADLPALAGVDPLLAAALGPDYGAHNKATVEAGSRVAEVMRSLGRRDCGPRPLPATCVARTGQLWR